MSYYLLLPCSLLYTLLKDKCTCLQDENCKSLVLQDTCNIVIFLSIAVLTLFQLSEYVG